MAKAILVIFENGNFEFFSRVTSIFDRYSVEEIGIKATSLNNYFCKLPKGEPQTYRGKKCTIYRGDIHVAPPRNKKSDK